eukprot:scaffold61489_cov69-Phaeocystis_antarctica.AAC.1
MRRVLATPPDGGGGGLPGRAAVAAARRDAGRAGLRAGPVGSSAGRGGCVPSERRGAAARGAPSPRPAHRAAPGPRGCLARPALRRGRRARAAPGARATKPRQRKNSVEA